MYFFMLFCGLKVNVVVVGRVIPATSMVGRDIFYFIYIYTLVPFVFHAEIGVIVFHARVSYSWFSSFDLNTLLISLGV